MFSYVTLLASNILGYQPVGHLGDQVKCSVISRYVEASKHEYVKGCRGPRPISKRDGVERVGPKVRSGYEDVLFFPIAARERVMAMLMSFES